MTDESARDEAELDRDHPWEALRAALAEDRAEALVAVLEELTLVEALRGLLALEPDERGAVLAALPPELAAGLIAEAPEETAAELVARLEPATAATIVVELDSDDQADLVGDLAPPDAEAILAEMAPEDAADVRRLVAYDESTAGGLMLSETFAFRVDETVGSIIRRLTSEDEDFERYRGQHPYIVDARERLVGVVSLRNLLLSPRYRPLAEIMVEPLAVGTGSRLDELEDLFDQHNFLGLPVVDEAGRLVGTVSRSAVAEASLERAESESLARQGVLGDELRSMPLRIRARRRLAWLSANIVLNVIAASVISAYEETLAAVIAIAVFLPMVSDMSGCSGNQAVAVSLRELALGVIKPIDWLRVWGKEASIGVINGIALGILIGIVAWLWKGNAWLGLVIGAALALNTLVAVSLGGLVPLALKRINQDPAVASGPLLTTVTDMAGFFLVLSFASHLMPVLD